MKMLHARRLPCLLLLLVVEAMASSCRPADRDTDSVAPTPVTSRAETSSALTGASEPLTLFHTNDVHGHFRSDKSPLKMGGLARLKTLVDGLRAKSRNSLLVDGGDWSEGTLYYTEGGGAENLKLMDLVGYDIAVVGNHDWLNGPDRLLDAVASASPRMSLVGANLEFPKYARDDEFRRRIPPFVIRQVGAMRVAFVGLVNSEITYRGFLAPIVPTDPAKSANALAKSLKSGANAVDAVIAISHNSVDLNKEILLAAPELDLIIGAHDHARLVHPVVVDRPGRPSAWIVEAGSWGRYLGRVELDIFHGGVRPREYRLFQVDRKTNEDRGVLSHIEALEKTIESKMGPVFSDHVAETALDLYRTGVESLIGDFVTDSYRQAAHTDVAIDQNNFIYGDLHEGALSSSDFFEANPPIYSLKNQRAWTLHTWSMPGALVSQVFSLMYLWRKTTASGGFSFSGMELVYDSTQMKENVGPKDLFGGLFGGGPAALRKILIGGLPVDPKRIYSFAASQGVIELINGLNEKFYGFVKMTALRDTGLEDWRIMAEYARQFKRIEAVHVPHGARINTWQPDLGIVQSEMRWDRVTKLAQITVRNYGANPNRAGAAIELFDITTGTTYDRDVNEVSAGVRQEIPELAPGASWVFTWHNVELTEDQGLRTLVGKIHYAPGEDSSSYNWSNDRTTRVFSDTP